MKKTLLCSLLAASLLVSGCVSYRAGKNGFDASTVDPYVTLNKTTLKDVRALLGTPTLTARDAEGNLIVGYGLVGHNLGAGIARNLTKSIATIGLGSKSREYVVKNVLFKLNNDNVVIDYKKNGASYLTRWRIKTWNECERTLTDDEVNSPVTYDIDQVCEVYAEEVAAKTGVPVDEVDTGKEFPFCYISCQTERGARAVYGELSNVDISVSKEDGDNSQSKLIFN